MKGGLNCCQIKLFIVEKDLQFNKITDITADLKLISGSKIQSKVEFNFFGFSCNSLQTIEQALLSRNYFPVEKTNKYFI
jgi:hypothetical protein